jgi:hypothetical protein
VGDVLLAARVLPVEVAVGGEDLVSGDLPGALVLLAVAPPCLACAELLVLERLCFGVVLSALGERVIVVPDLLRRPSAVEEEQVRRNARVGGEDAIRE